MKCCNAIMKFKEKPENFVMCELEKGHLYSHRGLCFEWEDENNKETTAEYGAWFRGLNIHRMIAQRVIKKLEEKGK